MITYLDGGWYERQAPNRLREKVVNGAIDAATMLYHADVTPQRVGILALKIHALAHLIHPPHRAPTKANADKLDERTRQSLAHHVQVLTDDSPVLQGFAEDCLDHVRTARELRALYLHFLHIGRMLHLLSVASLIPFAPPPRAAKAAKPSKKKVTKKKAVRKAANSRRR